MIRKYFSFYEKPTTNPHIRATAGHSFAEVDERRGKGKIMKPI